MTDEIWDPRGEARRALATAVDEHGSPVLADPVRLDNLLRDLLPDSPREAALVVAAAQLNVARQIEDRMRAGVDSATAVRLSAASLGQGRPFEPSACKWVAREFALALGLDVPTEPLPVVSGTVDVVEPAPVEPAPVVEPVPAGGGNPTLAGLPPTTVSPATPADAAVGGDYGTVPMPAETPGGSSQAQATAWAYAPAPEDARSSPPAARYGAVPPPPFEASGAGGGSAPPTRNRRSRAVAGGVAAAVVILGAGGAAGALLSGHHKGHTATSSTTDTTSTTTGLGTSTTAPPATTAAPSTTRSTTTTQPPPPPGGLTELAGFLSQSATARRDVGAATVGVEGCKEATATAITQIKASIDLREGVLGNLSSVSVTGISGGTTLVSELRSALTYSVAADHDFLNWLYDVRRTDAKRPQGAQGPGACSQYTKDRSWMAGNNQSVLANNAKTTFVAAWNPLAAKYHLATYQPDAF